MTTPEHSPLPWHIDEDGDILDANDYLVKIGSDKDDANFKLIVTAVNSRADLLAAAKRCIASWDLGTASDDGADSKAALRAAAAKAEEAI